MPWPKAMSRGSARRGPFSACAARGVLMTVLAASATAAALAASLAASLVDTASGRLAGTQSQEIVVFSGRP